MKGIILAAGKATRLYPVTKEISKMLLPIYNKPVIFYPARTLVESGVREIIVICRSNHLNQIRSVLNSYKELAGTNFKYKVKDHDLGMPYSILQAETWSKKEPIIVLPGDNIFLQNYTTTIRAFNEGAVVHLTKVDDPERFGTILYKNGKIFDLVEKPFKAQTKFVLTAPYIFDSRVYEYIRCLRPSKRGELEITELLKIYLSHKKLKFSKNNGYWNDVGTFDSIFEASNYIKNISNH